MGRRRGLIVAIEGPSGAGKTTRARAAARALGFEFLPEAYDLLRFPPSLGVNSEARLLATERRLLAAERRRYRSALARTRRGASVLADTGFLGPLAYTAGLSELGAVRPELFDRLKAVAGARWPREGSSPLPDLTVYLDVSERVRRARARQDPTGHPRELDRRHARVARFERAFYVGTLGRRYPGAVVALDGRGAPPAFVRRLEALLQRRPVPRAPRVPLRTLLALLSEKRLSGGVERRRLGGAAILKKASRSRPGPPDEAARRPSAEPAQAGPR